jgi:hypothetical protein
MKEKDNIKRIHEIMGVNKKVIVEQAYIDDLLQFLISRGARSIDELAPLITKLENQVADASTSTAAKRKTLNDIVTTAKKLNNTELVDVITAQILKDPGFVSKLVNDFFRNAEVKKFLDEMIESGFTPESAAARMVNEFGNKVLRTQSKGEVLDNQILREVNKQTRERFEKRTSELAKATDDTTTPKADEPETPSPEPNVSEKDIADMEDFTEESSWVNVPSYSDEEIDQLLKQEGGIGARLRNVFKVPSTKVKERAERLLRNSRKFAETKDPTIKARLRKKINEDILKLADDQSSALDGVREQLELVIDQAPRGRGGTIEDPGIRSLEKLYNDLKGGTNNFRDFLGISKLLYGDRFPTTLVLKEAFMSNTFRPFLKQLRSSLKGVSLGRSKILDTTITGFKESFPSEAWWKRAVYGDYRGVPTQDNPAYAELVRAGGKKAARASFLIALLGRLIKIRILYAFAETMRNSFAFYVSGKEGRDIINSCLSSGRNPENEACKKIANDKSFLPWLAWAMDIMEEGESSPFLKEMLEDFLGQSTDDFSGDLTREVMKGSPTLIDDLIYYLNEVRKGFLNQETADNMEDRWNQTEEELEDDLRQAEREIDQEIDNDTPRSSSGSFNTIRTSPELRGIIGDIASDLRISETSSELKNLVNQYLKVENGKVYFKCGDYKGVLRPSGGRWYMDFGSGGNYKFGEGGENNLATDYCSPVSSWSVNESNEGLINVLLEQRTAPVPGTDDSESATGDGSSAEPTQPDDPTPPTPSNPDTPDTESSRCVETLSESFFCKRCENGNSISECDQLWGNDLYTGKCFDFDKKKISNELSNKMACRFGDDPKFSVGKSQLQEENNLLYVLGEKKDQETKDDLQLKKVVNGGNRDWVFMENGQWLDFFNKYHGNVSESTDTVNKTFSGLENILEIYRKNIN